MVKLRIVISLIYEKLTTILCDCKSAINIRPLRYKYIAEESADLIAITQAMFIYDIRSEGVPDIHTTEASNNTNRSRNKMKLKE